MMNGLTSFQAKILANYFLDISKGALLVAMGFSAFNPVSVVLRLTLLVNGLLVAVVFLYVAMYITKEIQLND